MIKRKGIFTGWLAAFTNGASPGTPSSNSWLPRDYSAQKDEGKKSKINCYKFLIPTCRACKRFDSTIDNNERSICAARLSDGCVQSIGRFPIRGCLNQVVPKIIQSYAFPTMCVNNI